MTTTPPSPFSAPFARGQRHRSASTPNSDDSTELSPVLGEDDESNSIRSAESNTDVTGNEESKRQQLEEKFRRVLVLVILSLLLVFTASAYSIVGPFLPIEVCII